MLVWSLRLLLAAVVLSVAAGVPAFASEALPVHVSISAVSAPGVGQEGLVNATVTTDYDLPDVSLRIEPMPDGRVTRGSTAAFARMKGAVPAKRSAVVVFNTPGNKLIRAVVRAEERPGVVWSAVDYLAISVGPKAGKVGFDKTIPPLQAEQVAPGSVPVHGPPVIPAGFSSSRPTELLALEDGTSSAQAGDITPAGMLTVSGRWCFHNRDRVLTGQDQNVVELLRASDSAHLAWAYTDTNGNFTFPAVTNPGTAVYVQCGTYTDYGSGNKMSIIALSGDEWADRYRKSTSTFIFPDGNQSVGTWTTTTSDPDEKAFWIKDDYIKAYRVPPDVTGRHVAEWSSTSAHGTHYHPGGNIHLMAGDADDTPDTVLHEMGHSVMYNIYGNYMPPYPNCNPHYLMGSSSTGCGWTEGWAQTWHCWTTGNAIRSYPGGGGVDLEAATWGDGYDTGDTVEGRVAGAIWDITDSTNEGYDSYDGSWLDVWDVMWNVNCDTFADFWAQWKARGHAKHGPVACLYQSTIDYDTAPTFSGLPDVTRNENTTNNNVIDLWLRAYDPESSDSQLTYTIIGNSNPDCGASIDSVGYLDINPTPHWHGTSVVSIRCSDGVKWASDSLLITIVRVDDPPSISGLPDKILGRNSSWNEAIDLWSYASDPYDEDSALVYTITASSDPGVGASVGSNRYIALNPAVDWTGKSFVTVRVTDPDGFWDEDTFAVLVGDMVASCAAAREKPDGSWVYTEYLTTVTAVFPDAFYMEDWDRTSGIRVAGPAAAPLSNHVWVAGQMTSYYGERAITPHITTDYGVDTTPPAPIYFNNITLGGASPNPYTRQVPEDRLSGCYNVGLLARTTGEVVNTSGSVFWVDDGSHATYSSALSALYVDWSVTGMPAPPVGARVAMTGISGATTLSGDTIPKFRPRSAADVMGLGGEAAYIYTSDLATATAFGDMLAPYAWRLSRYSTAKLLALSKFDVIIIGYDATDWSDPGLMRRVLDAGRPVIAIGNGGARFLDQVHTPELNIGWGPSAGGSANTGYVADTDLGTWYFDQQITIPGDGVISIQKAGGNYEVYDPPVSVTRILRDPTSASYWPICREDRFMQWGYNGTPSVMSTTGAKLFVNCLYYMQGK